MKFVIESLDPGEVSMVKTLLAKSRITQEQVKEFLAMRGKVEQGGKLYLGDILVERGFITNEVLEEFFTENNHLYRAFLSNLVDGGFMSSAQRLKVLDDPDSAKTIVSVIEKLGIMTKDNFIKLFASKVNSLRLGDWLLAKRKIGLAELKKALEEQKMYRFEDYVVYHGILPRETVNMLKEKLGLA